ncbi:MAG: cache domain-containing protein [Deltaproteobacteria bacterium]|nr:cache domain-containing protein [Deltaproteobacteria bacterium]
MKINTKIMVMITLALVLTSLIVGAMAVWQLDRNGAHSIAQIEKLGRASIQDMKLRGETEIDHYRKDILEAKKDMLRSEVQTAASFLEKGSQDADAMTKNALTGDVRKAILSEQQENTAKFIGKLRYGPKNQDYFWINDMQPKMVMHPYKPNLNGKDLSGIKDPDGKEIFMAFVKICREKGEGFVHYSWPRYGVDKPVPKLSFVKLFKKWGWVIGTGVYLDQMEKAVQARKAALDKQVKAAEAHIINRINTQKKLVNKNIRHVTGWIAGITLFILFLGLAFCYWFMRRSITLPVNRIVEGLSEGAEEVAAGSSEVSSASQSLAQGASEQAASIEETSSSLEEIASMTKQNAENATQADALMKEANRVVGEANQAMANLTSSMEEISRASEETQKIIKTIDEIAFQTNLLALNAAVEAARAGEAGAGFAVVADEVRNLAMRTAEAAKDTATLIEQTSKKVMDGSILLSQTNEAFGTVADSTAKVGELVAEIAAASNEQAQGIEQVNRAVSDMDTVVQQNAANAEESASASQEMNAQAENMKGIVQELVALVGIGRNGNSHHFARPLLDNTFPVNKKGSGRRALDEQARSSWKPAGEPLRPEQVIPMDDDFQDF